MKLKINRTTATLGTAKRFTYAIDMTLVNNIQYSDDGTYCVAESDEFILGTTIATEADILGLNSLEDNQTDVVSLVTEHRRTLENAGVVHNGNTWDTDYKAQLTVFQTLAAMETGAIVTLDWKTQTGWINVNAVTLSAAYAAGLVYVQGLFATEKAKTDAILATSTPEELVVEKANITTGW